MKYKHGFIWRPLVNLETEMGRNVPYKLREVFREIIGEWDTRYLNFIEREHLKS